MTWQALLDPEGRVVTVNNWEHSVGIPCTPETPIGYMWNGSEFVEDPAEKKARLSFAVQRHLDNVAAEKKYDSILSACSYSYSSDPIFYSDACKAIGWRDAVWRVVYGIFNDFDAGLRPLPADAEALISELPLIDW